MPLRRCALAPLRLLLPLPHILPETNPHRNLMIIIHPHPYIGGEVEVVTYLKSFTYARANSCSDPGLRYAARGLKAYGSRLTVCGSRLAVHGWGLNASRRKPRAARRFINKKEHNTVL